MRQLLVENAVLALSGGVLGVLLARAILPALVALLPTDTPRLAEITIDPRVAGLVILAAVFVGLTAGAGPALGVSRLRTATLLRSVTSSEGRGARRLRVALVSAEVALAVVLTIGAGLMLQTMWKLQRVDPGFDARGVLTAHVPPSGANYRDISITDYYAGILERLRALPGVTAVGAVQHLPFSGYSWQIPFEVEGQPVSPGAASPTAGARIVTPGYFAAIGQPLLAGREIERADAATSTSVVVSKHLAETFFGSPDKAVGRVVRREPRKGSSYRCRSSGWLATCTTRR